MRGIFRTNKLVVHNIAEDVVIVVDSNSTPAGIWRGALRDIEDLSKFNRGLFSTKEYDYYCGCTAIITDSRVSQEWYAHEPDHGGYTVIALEESVSFLFGRIDEQKKEINGLKKNHAIETKVLHGAMKAMVSPESAEILKDITQEKKMSDKEAIEKLDILIPSPINHFPIEVVFAILKAYENLYLGSPLYARRAC